MVSDGARPRAFRLRSGEDLGLTPLQEVAARSDDGGGAPGSRRLAGREGAEAVEVVVGDAPQRRRDAAGQRVAA